VVYIELTSTPPDAESLALRLDEALARANAAYAGYRAGGHRLAPPSVRLLRPGTFQALETRRLAESPGLGRTQIKTPRLLGDERSRQLLEADAAQP
jgi:hypothetical protein